MGVAGTKGFKGGPSASRFFVQNNVLQADRVKSMPSKSDRQIER